MLVRTFNDIYDGRTHEMSEDGTASLKFTEPCHHVVRFISRTVLTKPVELQVVVIIVRDELEASFRGFDVLQCGISRQYSVSKFNFKNVTVLCEACSILYALS